MYDIRKDTHVSLMGLILTVAADAREKRVRKVMMDAMENFMTLLVVEICRLERISRDFWFEKSPRSTKIYMIPVR